MKLSRPADYGLLPIPVIELDADANCIYANERFLELTNLSLAAAAGQGWLSAVRGADRERVAAAFVGAAARNPDPHRAWSVDFSIGGARRGVPISCSAAAVLDGAGAVVGQLVTMIPVRARPDTEEQRRAIDAGIRGILDRLPDAVIVRVLDRFAFWNRAALLMVGYTDAEVATLTPFEMVNPRDNHLVDAMLEVSRREPSQEPAALQLHRRDGAQLLLEAVSVTLPFDGEPATYTFLRDLTQRRQLEKRMQLADRLASVGTMAAGIAHEINNPLAFVMANIDFLIEELRDHMETLDTARRDELSQVWTEIRMGTDRIRRVVRGLKLFSRTDEEEQTPQSVRAVLETALQMAQNEIRHSALLHLEFGEAPPVLADESRLVQAFLNLLISSVHAIPGGAAHDHEIRVVVRGDARRAIVEVSDTGRPLPAEVQAGIFNPLGPTTSGGFGTGLAVSISHGIITSLGGELSIEAQPVRGTKYRVILPAAPLVPADGPSSVAPPTAASPVLSLLGRILVVDDDQLILSTLKRVLSRDYAVEVAASGVEARARILAGDRFDAILSDVMMPDVSGGDLYAEVLRIAPEQAKRMVFMTGGAFTASARAFLAGVTNTRLDKPLDLKQLRRVLQAIIREPSP